MNIQQELLIIAVNIGGWKQDFINLRKCPVGLGEVALGNIPNIPLALHNPSEEWGSRLPWKLLTVESTEIAHLGQVCEDSLSRPCRSSGTGHLGKNQWVTWLYRRVLMNSIANGTWCAIIHLNPHIAWVGVCVSLSILAEFCRPLYV